MNGPNPPDHLRGRWCRLVPLLPADLEAVYEMAMSGEAFATWRLRGQTLSFEQFVASAIGQPSHCQFAVWATHATSSALGGRPAGIVELNNVDQLARVGYLSILTDAEAVQGTPIAGEAISLLLGHAFDVVGLRKVYAETTSVSLPSLDRGTFSIAREEGRLREHVMMKGELRDVIVLAVYAEDFRRLISRTSPRREGRATDLVRQAIAEVTDGRIDVTEAPGGVTLSELGIDSLELVEVLLMIDQLLGSEVHGDQKLFVHLQDLIEHVERRRDGLQAVLDDLLPDR